MTSRARQLIMKSAAVYSGTNVLAQAATFSLGSPCAASCPPR